MTKLPSHMSSGWMLPILPYRSNNNPDNRYSCSNCAKSYKWRESLLKHRRIECGKLPAFGCEICGYRFMHKHHLLKHRKTVHHTPIAQIIDSK